MSEKFLKRTIFVMAAMVLFNVVMLVRLNAIINAPQTTVKTEVLGAVFRDTSSPNIIDVPLVRPPRQAVIPGDKCEQGLTLTNTTDSPIYFRCTYMIRIEDGDDLQIAEYDSNVNVGVNENWEYRDGYWYYKELVQPGEQIPGPIDYIEYSDNFDDHLDYQVYVPLVIEGVEARGYEIEDVYYWPETDVREIDHYRRGEGGTWTTAIKIDLF